MKKKILGLSFIALSAITLASCGGGSGAIYKNNLTKGSSVNSVTLDYMDPYSGNVESVTINSTDTYKEMAKKLGEAYPAPIGPKCDVNGYYPFFMSANRTNKSTAKNDIFVEVEKNEQTIREKANGKYVVGDYSLEQSKTASVNYLIANNGYQEKFYLEDYKRTRKEEYTNIPGGNVSSSINDAESGIGLYYKHTGSMTEGGSIEYATNNRQAYGLLYNCPTTKMSGFKMYFNTSYQAGDPNGELQATYASEANDMILTVSDIGYENSAVEGAFLDSGISAPHYFGYVDLGNYGDQLQRLIDYSFELTDKYLIIKNKINTSKELLQWIVENGSVSEERLNDLLQEAEGSYSYTEMWLNYKDVKIQDSLYRLTYDYFKADRVSKSTSQILWSADSKPYYIDNETFDSLGASGKTCTKTSLQDNHFEAYRIDASQDDVNAKKNTFVNQCKDGNFFTKYKYAKKN